MKCTVVRHGQSQSIWQCLQNENGIYIYWTTRSFFFHLPCNLFNSFVQLFSCSCEVHNKFTESVSLDPYSLLVFAPPLSFHSFFPTCLSSTGSFRISASMIRVVL